MPSKDNPWIIKLTNVSKIYNTYPTPRHRLLEIVSGGKKSYSQEKRALDEISFTLKKGDRLGIVGENGSGKSTLLKILAGVLTPTSGKVIVNGRVSALLELGAGFNPELTGYDNIKQFCILHGMQKEDINTALPEIIQFSELGNAIDHPVKTYSSGMSVRLGFACAVYVQPDILIVDEALSVGDAYFQNKCLHKIRSMLDEGITFIYVTHAADSIRTLCDNGLWLQNGKIKLLDNSIDVGTAYQSEIFSRMVRSGFVDTVEDTEPELHTKKTTHRIDISRKKAFTERVAPLRSGSGEILIDDIVAINSDGEESDAIEFDTTMTIRVFFHCNTEPPENCTLTVGIVDKLGNQILHFNSAMSNVHPSDAPLHIQHMIEFSFQSPLCPGEYGIISGIGILSDHPQKISKSIIESLVDSCSGGARFSVSYPLSKINKDLWGSVYVNSVISMHSLD